MTFQERTDMRGMQDDYIKLEQRLADAEDERDKTREAYSDTLLELAKKTSENDRLLGVLEEVHREFGGQLPQKFGDMMSDVIAKARGRDD